MDKNLKEKLIKISFIVSISGIFLLLLLNTIIEPIKIRSYQQLNKLKPNSLVSIDGKISSIKNYTNFIQFKINNITLILICKSCNLVVGEEVSVNGKISYYKKEKRILVEKLKVLR